MSIQVIYIYICVCNKTDFDDDAIQRFVLPSIRYQTKTGYLYITYDINSVYMLYVNIYI